MSTYVLEESAYTKNNIVMLWARDINTKEIHSFAIQNFKPYFFVPDDAGQFTSCYNTPLRKIECDSPADLKQRLPYFKQTFDADIPLDMRWRIDNKIMYAFDENFTPVELDEPLAPKVMFYDIEVQASDVFPTPELAEYPIVSIATYNTYNDDIKVFTTLPIKGAKQYKSEKGMIEAFARYIKTEDFDVISGWYNQSFDDPYIFNRAQKLYANISGFSRTKQKRPWERDIFTTRTNIDLMEIFRAWSLPLGQQESYGLKFIARKFASFEYDDFGAEIDELIKQKRFKALYDYACNDVIALARIDKACSLINFYENLRQMTGVKLNQVLQKTRIYEYYLMFCYDYPLPTRTTRQREPFEGAYVKEPTVGITENVGAVDLAALYPNIIVGYNVSPDSFNMIPSTLIKLMNRREELREMKLRGEGGANLKTTEQSLKYIINSSYGVMAYPTFKLYDMKCAKFIPAKGQEIIKEIIKYLEAQNYSVVYGDTDSSYFAPVLTPEDGKKIEAEINEFLLEWGIKDGSFVAPKVKFETLYRRIFFKGKNHGEEAAKKRYIGHIVWEDGFEENKLGYKGIELKRSDVAPITKTAMTNFFSKLLIDGDEDGAIKYIVKLVNEICAGKIPLIELAIPRGVSNPNNVCPHNRGINNTTKVLGLKLQRERKPQLIYCKRPVKEVVIDENMNEYVLKNKVVVDYETIMQKTIKNKFESIFKAIGRSWNKDIEFQCSLDRWM